MKNNCSTNTNILKERFVAKLFNSLKSSCQHYDQLSVKSRVLFSLDSFLTNILQHPAHSSSPFQPPKPPWLLLSELIFIDHRWLKLSTRTPQHTTIAEDSPSVMCNIFTKFLTKSIFPGARKGFYMPFPKPPVRSKFHWLQLVSPKLGTQYLEITKYSG